MDGREGVALLVGEAVLCPSCLGRRLNAAAANLIERVLPDECSLRQWVLTFPFAWRLALAQDGALLRSLIRVFEDTLQGFYARRALRADQLGGKTGCVTVVQRASSDLPAESPCTIPGMITSVISFEDSALLP